MSKEKQFPFLKLIIFLLFITTITLKAQDIIWERTFDTGQDDQGKDVCTDFSGNVVVTGSSSGKWLTIKYNPDGDTLWTRTFKIGSSAANGVASDPWGNVIVVGKIHTDSTGDDFCTVKYDPDGNILWMRNFSNHDTEVEEAHSVAVDSKGNIIVTGFTFFISSGYSYDYQTIKYDPDGNVIWIRTYDGGWNDFAEAVAVDNSDNVIVVGKIHTDSTGDDFCTVKYDPNGNILWMRNFSNHDTEVEEAHSVVVDSKGNVIVTGFTFFISSGYSYDYQTIKYDPDGNVIWVRTYDGGWNDIAEAVAVDNSDNVIVTGYSDSNINWDWCTVKYSPEEDIK